MEIKVNDLTSVDKEITILANREDLQPKFDKAYKGIRPKVNLPGFRPGKAPIGLIKEEDLVRKLKLKRSTNTFKRFLNPG